MSSSVDVAACAEFRSQLPVSTSMHRYVRDLTCSLLEVEGYATRGLPNGGDAVTSARASTPSLIIMDLRMPVLDGVAAIRTLKDDPRTATIPIIALSAGLTLLAQAHALPIEAVLPKPFELDALLSLVRRATDPDAPPASSTHRRAG